MEVEVIDDSGEEIDNLITGTASSGSNDASNDAENLIPLQGDNAPGSQESEIESVTSETKSTPSQSTECDEDPVHESKKRKLSDECEDDGKLCTICLDNWTNTGDHRICALKCGHLFGHHCIVRWISVNKSCPTCKLKGSKYDLRFIYANKLIAMDTTELTILQKQLDMVTEEKNRIQIDLTKAICKEHLLTEEIQSFKKKIKLLSDDVRIRSQSQTFGSQKTQRDAQLRRRDSMIICHQGSCRVMAAHPSSNKFVISLKSPVSLFSGFGVRQYSMDNFLSLTYTPLHKEAIRDVKFNQTNSWQLSVSLDKAVKIVDINTNDNIGSYLGNSMLWSCCWDANKSHLFYVGQQQGSVQKFDTRRMSEPLETFEFTGDKSPVVSLVSIPSYPSNAMPLGGIVACKLNSTWAFENVNGSQYMRHLIPIEGPFVSMSYNLEDSQLLISTRPNSREHNARHIVCSLEKSSNDVIRTNIVHTFCGGRLQKQLSRTCFIQNVTNQHAYVAAQQDGSIVLWSINNGLTFSTVKRLSPVIDLMSLSNSDGSHLLALSEERLDLYKFYD